MEVRIGHTLDGQPIGHDISSNRPLLLLGDTGRGKTTIARYLTRWWLADTDRHAHVATTYAGEWADLRCEPCDLTLVAEPANRDRSATCTTDSCLVVIDDLTGVDDERLDLLLQHRANVIATWDGSRISLSPAAVDAELSCLGLVRPDLADPREMEVLRGQGRLDWPAETIAVIPDQRAPLDLPRHRWQTRHFDRHTDTARDLQRLAPHEQSQHRLVTG